jgi:hypothetical protein
MHACIHTVRSHYFPPIPRPFVCGSFVNTIMVTKTRVASSATMKTKKGHLLLPGEASMIHGHPSALLSVPGDDNNNTPAAAAAATATTMTASSSSATPSMLLARGLSARYCGANIPFTNLTADEMERDLRHMEAFSNACLAYAQQYYIYQNSAASGGGSSSSGAGAGASGAGATTAAAAAEDNKHNSNNNNNKHKRQQQSQSQSQQPPMIAMPVRIDPEEEKRLSTLRHKIQHCEAQREVLESQYLSLRAHYVHMSQRLKNGRVTVQGRVTFLQSLVKQRGQLLALQRARLQISREALACLHYRQSGGKVQVETDEVVAAAAEVVATATTTDKNDDNKNGNHGDEPPQATTTTNANTNANNESSPQPPPPPQEEEDLVEIWNQIDEQFKQAEESCRTIRTVSDDDDDDDEEDNDNTVVSWQALKVPKIPPGVPLLLSQLAKPPGFAAAWSTGGVFGSQPESLCWLEPEFPPLQQSSWQSNKRSTKSLTALRDQVSVLQGELRKEHDLNRTLQTNILGRRKANIELVAMMALLRTETEAVVARHNILLESEVAKDAALRLQEMDDDDIDELEDDDDNGILNVVPTTGTDSGTGTGTGTGPTTTTTQGTAGQDKAAVVVEEQVVPTADAVEGEDASALSATTTSPAVVGDPALDATAADATTKNTAATTGAADDDENDGDDEAGGEPDEDSADDEGEIVEGGGVATAGATTEGSATTGGAEKRALEHNDDEGEPPIAADGGSDGSSSRNKRRKL